MKDLMEIIVDKEYVNNLGNKCIVKYVGDTTVMYKMIKGGAEYLLHFYEFNLMYKLYERAIIKGDIYITTGDISCKYAMEIIGVVEDNIVYKPAYNKESELRYCRITTKFKNLYKLCEWKD